MEQEENLNGAVEDTAKTDAVLEDLIDLHNGVVGLLRSTIRHIVYVQQHLRHLLEKKKNPSPNQTSLSLTPDRQRKPRAEMILSRNGMRSSEQRPSRRRFALRISSVPTASILVPA